ncbi:unnamed protein product [Rangifer tarandus platyrhynchus]|uniref:Uncharacterized protein n=1 Tax=Rangifer tarandus platyrhynchus TaxID=3082113 RepID=A0AC59Y328_RANTA
MQIRGGRGLGRGGGFALSGSGIWEKFTLEEGAGPPRGGRAARRSQLGDGGRRPQRSPSLAKIMVPSPVQTFCPSITCAYLTSPVHCPLTCALLLSRCPLPSDSSSLFPSPGSQSSPF